MNVFSNFIPNKLVTFNDKDPPWMSEYLKKKIKWRNKIYAVQIMSVQICMCIYVCQCK